MEFDVRQSGAFVFNILLMIIAGFMAVISLVFFWHAAGFLHYSFILWLIIALIRGYNYFNYLVLAINKKPVLIINDTYISDEANQIKYYWEDILGMTEQNLYLYIKVKNPEAYLQRISNPFRKLIIEASGPAFRLNLDLIKCDPEVLIELIDDTNPVFKDDNNLSSNGI